MTPPKAFTENPTRTPSMITLSNVKPQSIPYSYLQQEYWWECPECGNILRTEEEANRCYQLDTWPEDCREWMHRGLISLPTELLEGS